MSRVLWFKFYSLHLWHIWVYKNGAFFYTTCNFDFQIFSIVKGLLYNFEFILNIPSLNLFFLMFKNGNTLVTRVLNYLKQFKISYSWVEFISYEINHIKDGTMSGKIILFRLAHPHMFHLGMCSCKTSFHAGCNDTVNEPCWVKWNAISVLSSWYSHFIVPNLSQSVDGLVNMALECLLQKKFIFNPTKIICACM